MSVAALLGASVPRPGGAMPHVGIPTAEVALKFHVSSLPSPRMSFCGFVLARGFPGSEWFWPQIPLFPFPK